VEGKVLGCIDEKKISAYPEGGLPDDEGARIKTRPGECAACRPSPTDSRLSFNKKKYGVK
jgi:hypothetical protein